MFKLISLKLLSAAAVLTLLAACAGPAQRPDYTAFKKSQPRSVLVLPPINNTADVNATYGVLSQVTLPLAESGYYVIPVAPMEETFKHNGLTAATDIQQVAPAKLHDIFGADAALYMTVTQYGSVYTVLDSTTVVSASAKLIDLKTGDVLWQGTGRATGKEVGANANLNVGGGLGLIVMMAQAAVKQIAHTLSDDSVDVAALTSQRLLSAGPPNGLLYGPRSTKFGTD
ncbi:MULTISPECIES: DUF799 domain-containing protein [Paraburkholderia]|uniref:Lipoprotein n=1 Tax=Paraburkholderia megapolitana TaxID=420953 RepID=A0A1I3GDN5_9BURK|nr:MULTISPECIES: DUF799 domain-containing protein [Paraburkholderia]MCX4160306.1 DUF799 domain-containing protein [Paraburkholderia megapolitana]MDN7155805.1 DUF799 domain-containing protein [Paraburkholderia sp. CHISQ3]MDQ6492849.1 DUF799 domain-containing protein [Paraburkholderia megapolitana]QDQ82852.1 hypothetical protein FNZ07_16545 [Paraburkholderia megapolitana]SFI21352.1 hypothetical protein SAMN05192543_102460 [Paraburkholderia megapolitana]